MKKIISIILVLTAILTLTAVPAMAEDAGEIEENGFVCERLRNSNLILVKYIGDASGKIVNIPSSVKGSHGERIASNAFGWLQSKRNHDSRYQEGRTTAIRCTAPQRGRKRRSISPVENSRNRHAGRSALLSG